MRKDWMRKQAITVFELTKGFTPEQRNAFSNAMNTMEEMAGYVLELTNETSNPQPTAGPVWVNMGRKFPDDWIEAKMRVALSKKEIIELDIKSAHNEYFIMEDGSELYYKDCEWIDETVSAMQVFTREVVEDALIRLAREFRSGKVITIADVVGWMNTNYPEVKG